MLEGTGTEEQVLSIFHSARKTVKAKRTNLLSYNNLRHCHHNNYLYHRKDSNDLYIDHCDMETKRKHNLLAYGSSKLMLVLLL